jgi:ABC-type phosphate transport system substrate-binding protein
MNVKFSFLATLVFCGVSVFTGCEKINTNSPYIDGLSIDSYPVVDGSTSTLPLNTVIASELMGLNYNWKDNRDSESGSTGASNRMSEEDSGINMTGVCQAHRHLTQL